MYFVLELDIGGSRCVGWIGAFEVPASGLLAPEDDVLDAKSIIEGVPLEAAPKLFPPAAAVSFFAPNVLFP